VEVDVAIIGAGPAGATLAALLARRGVHVALYDRDQFPRDKVCGEFLSYDALPLLGALGLLEELDRAGAPHIDRCRIIGSSRTFEFSFPHAARGVSRWLLDDLLVRTAVSSGAEVHLATTISELQDVHARVIVGAWGRWGRFDQQLDRAFIRDRSHRNFGFKRHYTGEHAHGAIDLYSFERGYLGVNAIEGGLTNICGLVHASRLTGHKGRWDAFIDTLRREEAALETLYAAHPPAQDAYLTSEPVIFRARSAVEHGVFMIGDASGVIDPLTGNGMAMAVQSALLVAPFVLRALSTRSRAMVEDDYRDAHRRFFATRIAWSRRVAVLLSRPRLLDAAMTAIRWKAIGEWLLRRTRGTREDVVRMTERWFA
jgi:flavin-dependent dehydrogenase